MSWGRGDSARFGEARSLLAMRPASERFDALVELIGDDGDPPPEVIAYIGAHLASWPDTIRRVVPEPWLGSVCGGVPCPAVRLCNQLLLGRETPLNRAAIDGLARSHDLGNITSLVLARRVMTARQLELLLTASSLTAMARLALFDVEIDDSRGAFELDEVEATRLRSLNISNARVSGDFVSALVSSPICDGLEQLRLSRLPSGLESFKDMLSAASVRALEELALVDCRVDMESLITFVGRCDLSRSVRVLDLEKNTLRRGAIRTLCRADGFSNLRELSLRQTALDARAFAPMIKATRARELESLELGVNPELTLEDLLPFFEVPGLGLRRLGLRGLSAGRVYLSAYSERAWRQIGEAFSSASFWPLLEELDLSYVRPLDAGISALAATEYPRALRRLDLSNGRLRAAAINSLCVPDVWPSLQELDLTYCQLTPEVVAPLFTSQRPPALRELVLRSNFDLGVPRVREWADAVARDVEVIF